MMLLVSAVDMVMVFLGIEIMSIPIYVLAASTAARSAATSRRSSTS